MDKDNKIINFSSISRKKADYKLEAEICIYVRKSDKKYFTDWSPNEDNISDKQIYYILKEIYEYLLKKHKDFKYTNFDESFEITITFLYYVNCRRKIKCIYLPQNLSEEQVIRYLFITLFMYEIQNGILN